ncbi:uroporphyrinogen-III synthase [Marinibaculum pumilum]|uniref:Uroporphyrinogen-III synthase n=1 Tax=Marinibaculum pumilum TaxID=1766165 RepID=A0ABV7KXV0_9PROT
MRILVTRPQPDADAFAALLAARGVTPVVEPLLTVRIVADGPPDGSGAQAVLLTSANGARALARACGGALTAGLAALPAWAVGAATAAAARDAGFAAVHDADGDAAALAAAIRRALAPADGPLLHVRAHHVAGDLSGALAASGFEVRPAVLYRTEGATALSPRLQADLRAGTLDGVTLFSPRTARAFASLLVAAGLADRARDLTAFCLSAAVADAAGELPWRDRRTAAVPRSEALLDLVAGQAAPGERLQGVEQ